MSKSPEARKRKRLRKAANRRERLVSTDKTGWRVCSEYHLQKTILGVRVNWWPSTQKCSIESPPVPRTPKIERQTYRVSDEYDITQIIMKMQKEQENA